MEYTEGKKCVTDRLKAGHFEAVLANLGIGIILQDKNGLVIASNPKTAEIFDTTLDDIHDPAAYGQLWKTTKCNGNPVPFENSPPMIALRDGRPQTDVSLDLSTKDGGKRQLVINAWPLFDERNGSLNAVISSIADLSEEAKLRVLCAQKEALFTSFMDHSPSFAWIVDENEKLIYANQGLLDYFGADKRALNQNICTILPQFIADAYHNKHKWVLENNLPHSSILKSSGTNGEEQVFHVTTFPAEGPGGKKMVGGQAWYITDSYNARLELRKTNERLLYLSRASSESIWDWDVQTGQIFRNPALLRLIGYHDEQPRGLSWWFKQIHPDDRQRVKNKIDRVLAEKEKAWDQEYRFLCFDDSYKVVLDRGFVVYQDGIPVRMVGSLQDITEIKQLELRLVGEKLKKQQQIAEAILHAQEQERTRIALELHDNVNQILFTSKLYLDLIPAAGPGEQEIKNKTRDFILLAIEEIRKLSKYLVSPPLMASGLMACIKSLVKDLEMIGSFNLEFTCTNEKEIDALNHPLQVTLFRITQEQVKNIIQYSQADEVNLHLSVRNGQVHLRISDNGIGFDTRREKKGIGLSNIFQRTKLYNGKIDLQAQPGQGCKLEISIPIV
jgi:PAS domain S-box-containing protein